MYIRIEDMPFSEHLPESGDGHVANLRNVTIDWGDMPALRFVFMDETTITAYTNHMGVVLAMIGTMNNLVNEHRAHLATGPDYLLYIDYEHFLQVRREVRADTEQDCLDALDSITRGETDPTCLS